ncbi:fumarylacetoacetate hydrolase family protein [Caulobacter sp. NIBR1757]|uniref:2-keto-4-pentenoate hydratase n=1 Tax=Caulobacter sp. NIBR1757 TaxID=3016000 RepID=UPI0022F10992|nr:fumarylacetoacetate hydrolase family protein [Caulobacter sp. NIBR1757]WGM39079.1 2-keto-4-pentenoate hydratase [Caulobacter sp. NIBR1757]
MKRSAASTVTGDNSAEIARAFTTARRDARPLPGFPGAIPADLAGSYAIQDQALDQWGEAPVGWKVGRIAPDLQGRLGEARVAGPVFARNRWLSIPGQVLDVPVFVGGFAAVEGEFVYRLGADAPAGKTAWTAAEALDLADGLFVGVEIAGSPLATINALGPLVVASDFGNNWGLILGPAIDGWRSRPFDSLTCRTSIDGALVGTGSAADLPDGPAEAFAWLLGHCAARGRPLKAGDLVTTGAVTGVHDIVAGQTARIDFGAFGEILCRAKPAGPIGEEETTHEQRDRG